VLIFSAPSLSPVAQLLSSQLQRLLSLPIGHL